MTEVLLAGCRAHPMEPRGELLVEGLAARGVTAAWATWDDETVDWSAARAVAVRSTWDYLNRREEFLTWAKAVDAVTYLLNGADTLRWNTDKSYLLELAAAGVPVVPSRFAAGADDLARAAAEFPGRVVVKPCVGVGGIGVTVLNSTADIDSIEGDGPWLVQPVVESITTEGETSVLVLVLVLVLGGRVAGQIRKVATGGEIRVHPQYGGLSTPVAVTGEAAELALATVAAAERLRDVSLPYARVDLMRMPDGALALSELELTEPGLYLDVAPGHAEAYADMMASLLRRPAA